MNTASDNLFNILLYTSGVNKRIQIMVISFITIIIMINMRYFIRKTKLTIESMLCYKIFEKITMKRGLLPTRKSHFPHPLPIDRPGCTSVSPRPAKSCPSEIGLHRKRQHAKSTVEIPWHYQLHSCALPHLPYGVFYKTFFYLLQNVFCRKEYFFIRKMGWWEDITVG